MAAINQNDSFYANNKRTLKFTVIDKDAIPVGAMDLTGKHLRWTMSRLNDDGTYNSLALIVKTLGSGITVTNLLGGLCEVLLVETDTAKLSGRYHHQLEVMDAADANPVVIATGTLSILKVIKNS